MKFLKYLFYLCIGSLVVGPAISFTTSIPGFNISVIDFTVGLICLYWIIKVPLAYNLIRNNKVSKYFFLFAGVALFSFLLTPIKLTLQEKLISYLYLLRYVAYFFVYITAFYLIKTKKLNTSQLLKRLTFIGLSLSVIGWLQYLLYPDLRNLFYLGWDPHYKRIFASYFDPNYLGLMLVFTLILLWTSPPPSPIRRGRISVEVLRSWLSRIFVFVTLMFTYSRSSYLALITTSVFFSIFSKRMTYLLILLVILIMSIIVLPRPGGEGVKLERIFSVEQRIENWQLGVKIIKNHLILGVGFNTLRYARKPYEPYKLDQFDSHSAGGLDNSLLFVAVTTGIFGLITYLLLLYKTWTIGNLIFKLSLIAALTHSLFLNSLFFPPIMIWLWIALGLAHRE